MGRVDSIEALRRRIPEASPRKSARIVPALDEQASACVQDCSFRLVAAIGAGGHIASYSANPSRPAWEAGIDEDVEQACTANLWCDDPS
jgi:hypothetical protein